MEEQTKELLVYSWGTKPELTPNLLGTIIDDNLPPFIYDLPILSKLPNVQN